MSRSRARSSPTTIATKNPSSSATSSDVADPGLASAGEARIAWADEQMPVLRSLRERFAAERPLDGLRVAACLHVTAETANLARALTAAGADVALCAANPLATQDDVAAALAQLPATTVLARRGEPAEIYAGHVTAAAATAPQIVLDDGADLLGVLHEHGAADAVIGATEETTTGLVRLRSLADEGALRCPVLAVNEATVERAFNDRYGAGQSVLDGILRATNLLLAAQTVVVLGFGWTGRGVALRARGAGASVIVCEVDSLRALEARMEGFAVMPALEAAERGSIFITVTGVPGALRREHLERMRDGAVLANAGHFDVEIALDDLRALAPAGSRDVLPLVEQFVLADGRKLNLLARGQVVNLAAAQGHPASLMDTSFALQALAAVHLARSGASLGPGVHPVPEALDREVARLKLASLGVGIDELTDEQRAYLRHWSRDA